MLALQYRSLIATSSPSFISPSKLTGFRLGLFSPYYLLYPRKYISAPGDSNNMRVSILWGFTFAFRCQAVTYYMDVSCVSKFAGIWDEVHAMAKLGNIGLADAENNVNADAFKQIFKVDKTNTNAATKVASEFSRIDESLRMIEANN